MTGEVRPWRKPSSMNDRVTRDVFWSQVAFAFFIAVCVALHPGLVLKKDEGGMSNFGVHLKTVLPYTLALGLASALSFRAGQFVVASSPQRQQLKRVLRCYSALILLTLLTTYGYTLDAPLKYLHITVGVVITVFEFAASWWLYRRLRSLQLVVATSAVGFVLAVLTFFGVVHLLFVTQLLVGVSFALLLVRASRTMT